MVPRLYWHSGCVLHYYLNNDVSHACRCHWEQSSLLRLASVSFHTILCINDTSVLLGWSRSEDRTSGEGAKRGFSFLLSRRLTARLVAATKISATMRGRTIEFGEVAKISTPGQPWDR